MPEFDIVSKYLIQHYPDDFVRFTLGRDDVEVIDVMDPEQRTVEMRQTDSLLSVRIGGEEGLVHTEFQTIDSTHRPMPQRMAGYIGRLIEQYGLPVYAIVIYLRPEAGRRDPGHYLQDRSGHRILIEYQVLRLSEQDGQRILESGPVGLLPFAPLMQPAGQASVDWLRQCVQAAQALPLAEAARGNLLSSLLVLSGLVYAPATIATNQWC